MSLPIAYIYKCLYLPLGQAGRLCLVSLSIYISGYIYHWARRAAFAWCPCLYISTCIYIYHLAIGRLSLPGVSAYSIYKCLYLPLGQAGRPCRGPQWGSGEGVRWPSPPGRVSVRTGHMVQLSRYPVSSGCTWTNLVGKNIGNECRSITK